MNKHLHLKILMIGFFLMFTCNFIKAQNFIISGGNAFTAALDAYGNVWTWGDNGSGQLGRVTVGQEDLLPGLVNMNGIVIKSIDAGSASHVVAIDCNNEVWAWGDNSYKQLGSHTPAIASSITPVHVRAIGGGVGFLTGVQYVTSSTTTSFAIMQDKRVVAWGTNNVGQLGNGNLVTSNSPVYVTKTDGTDLTNIVAIDAGDQHCYALDVNGNVWAWGGNQYGDNGELGRGTVANSHDQTRAGLVVIDKAFTPLADIKMITAGDGHGLFYDGSGRLWSVGGDWLGQRGNTTGWDGGGNITYDPWWEFQPWAKLVASGEQQASTGLAYLSGVKHISAGQATSWALVDVDGDGYGNIMGWGANTLPLDGVNSSGTGILGRGNAGRVNLSPGGDGDELPVYVYKSAGVRMDNVVDISDGDGVCYFITEDPTTKDQQIWAFGNNNRGQLGDGTTVAKTFPVQPQITYNLKPVCPTATLTSNKDSACADGAITFNANTSGQYFHYLWLKDGVAFGANDTSSLNRGNWIFDPLYDKAINTFSGPGTYKVIVLDLAIAKVCNAIPCISSTSSLVINSIASPIASITGTINICSGTSTTLTGNGGTSYVWTGGATTPNLTTANLIADKTYTVTATTNGCTDTESVTVTVKALPTATITGTIAICSGFNTTLTGNGGATYKWTGGSTNTTLQTATLTTNATYSVTATTNGCTDAESVVVTVNPLPTSSDITGNLTPACIATGIIYSVVLTPGSSYAWSVPSGASITAGATGPNNNEITVNFGSTNGDVSVIETNSNSCISLAKSISISLVGCGLNANFSASATTICKGTEVTFTDISTATSGATVYSWNFGSGASPATASTVGPHTVTYTTSGAKTVSLTITEGISDIESKASFITVNALPTAAISGTTTICKGSSTNLTAAGGATYSWDDLSSQAIRTVTPSINSTYTVTAISLGCTDTEDLVITVNEMPTAAISGTTTICNGLSTSLTAEGGNTFKWDNASAIAIRTVNPVVNTTYTVTATSLGCTNTKDVIVVVNDLPTAIISGTTTICNGTSTNLTVAGGTSYFWDDASTLAIRTINPVVTTTYTVTVTTLGCTDTQDVIVTVNDLPTATITGKTTICNGMSTTLTAAGGTSFSWEDASVQAVRTVNPVVATTYIVTATTLGCTDTQDVVVTVNDLPTAVITGTTTICNGTSTTLTATGGTDFIWDDLSVLAQLTVSPTSTKTYIVTATTLGCTDTQDVVVTVNDLPTASITGTTTICNGTSITLTATGGTSFSWDDSSVQAQRSVNPTATITYTVTATTLGCTDTENVTVTVNNLPTAVITGTSTICNGSSTSLTVAGGASYNWDNSTSLAIRTVNPLANATYTVTAITLGCTDTETIVVVVNNLPTAVITGTNTICNTTSTTLTALGGNTFVWDDASTQSIKTVMPSANTKYTVTATSLGCTDTEEVLVTVNPLPTINAGVDASICAGKTYSILANGYGSGVSYAWSPVTQLSSTVDTSTIATPNSTTTYVITITNAQGCTSSDDIVIVVNSVGITQSSNSFTICQGYNQIFNVSKVGGENYIWYDAVVGGITLGNGDSYARANIAKNDTLYIESVSASGCLSISRGMVIINLGIQPIADFTYDRDSIMEDETIQFTNTSINAYKYYWDFGESNSASEEINPSFRYFNAGNKSVQLIAISTDGCIDTLLKVDAIHVKHRGELFIPSAFTPNGDNQNDNFEVYGENVASMHIKVYNEWGLLIWEADNQASKWDGTQDGKLQPSANYAYVFTCIKTDDTPYEKNGVVTLIR